MGSIDKIKAVVYNKKGSPDKFVYCDIDKPIPLAHEILIKIHAVSLNAADYRTMQLGIIPKKKIYGADISGIIETVGNKVQSFKPGDNVVGTLINSGYGGLAEYAVVPEHAVIKKPDGVSFEDASTLPIAGITALQALRNKGHIKQGQQVLIVGSAGSVGTFAVQLANFFNAEVTGVCSTKNVQQTYDLGADHVIDYTKESIFKQNKKYDLILAINGNYPLIGYWNNLTKNGVCVMVGGALIQIAKFHLWGWLLSLGTKKIKTVFAKETNDDLKILADLMNEGKIKSVIERTLPLSEAGDAMKLLCQGHSSGKVVIKIV